MFPLLPESTLYDTTDVAYLDDVFKFAFFGLSVYCLM